MKNNLDIKLVAGARNRHYRGSEIPGKPGNFEVAA